MENELYLPSQPFKGIDSFRYADRNIFSERDDEQSQLYSLIQIYRGSLLYGQSGIGKSSLIAAGLIPLLEKNYRPEIIRLYPNKNGAFIVSRILSADDPVTYLPSVFDQKDNNDRKITLSFTEFAKLISLQKRADTNTPQKNKTPVLIFDQFEELITLFEEAGQRGSQGELNLSERINLQEEIIKLLRYLYYDPDLNIKLLFVFREDYLAKFSKLFASIPDLNDHSFRLTAIPKSRLESIIHYPFLMDKDAIRYPNPFSKSFIKNLVDKLEKYLGEEDTALTDLQIVCLFLYNKPESERQKLIENDNPVKHILELFYLSILNKFNEQEKPIAISILSLLVLNERTRNIFHHDAIIKEYLEQTKNSNKQQYETQRNICENILIKLENETRILRKETRKGGDYYEIRSEAIIPYINQQKITKEKEKEFKKERRKRKKRLFYYAFILLLGGIFAIFYIFNLRNKNKEIILSAMLFKANEINADNSFFKTFNAYQIYERLNKEGISLINNQIKKISLSDYDISGKFVMPMKNNYILTKINDSSYQVWHILSKYRISLCKEYGNTSAIAISKDHNFFAVFSGKRLAVFNSETGHELLLPTDSTISKPDITFSFYSDYLTFHIGNRLFIVNPDDETHVSYKLDQKYFTLVKNIIAKGAIIYSYYNGNFTYWYKNGDSLVLTKNSSVSPDSWSYTGGDSCILIEEGKLKRWNLISDDKHQLLQENFTGFDKISDSILFLYVIDYNYGLQKTVYKNITLYNPFSEKLLGQFKAEKGGYFDNIAVNKDYSKNLVKDKSGNVLLLDITRPNPAYLDSLKGCAAYDITDDGKSVLFVKEINKEDKNKNNIRTAFLYQYNLTSNKIIRIDSIHPDENPYGTSTIYGKYYFRMNSSSEMVAYKRKTGDSLYLMVKNLSSGDTPYDSSNHSSYKIKNYVDDGKKLGFTSTYIHVIDKDNKQGILLLNGEKRRNMRYFSRIGVPEIPPEEWNNLLKDLHFND